jgi:hypothetical protein
MTQVLTRRGYDGGGVGPLESGLTEGAYEAR